MRVIQVSVGGKKCRVKSLKMDRGSVGLWRPTDTSVFDIYNLFVL